MEMQTFDNLESEVRGYVRAYPTVFKSASNARQVDENDKSYIDFFAGAGVLNFGHNNPRMKKALVDFIESDVRKFELLFQCGRKSYARHQKAVWAMLA